MSSVPPQSSQRHLVRSTFNDLPEHPMCMDLEPHNSQDTSCHMAWSETERRVGLDDVVS